MADKDCKMAINGPVFFLVQEQAKSVVAIQALQTRMAVLESLQERLMQAIDDVQQHLRAPNPPTVSKSYAQTTSPPAAEKKKLRFAESKNKSVGAGTKTDLSKSDSYNKDSGLGNSDCSLVTSDHHSLQEEDDDELLQLLELIDRKSLSLVKQVEGGASDVRRSEMESSPSMLDTLLFEKVNTQRQLSEVKAERDELRERLSKLELATHAVNKQKMKVQQQLDATLIENRSLQTRIVQSSASERRTESLSYMADIEKAHIKKKYLKYSEKSRVKVSSILKQTNVLELQKQLLAYVMENDILRAKLHQEEPSRVSSWLKIESDLRKKSKEMSDEKHKFREILQTKNLEIASLKDRIHQLEEQFAFNDDGEDESCVKNFGMRSTEDWREPGAHNLCNKRNNLNTESPFSPLGYGDFSKTQSLPPLQFLDVKAKRKKDESMRVHLDHIYDTGNFTEVPLHVSPQSINDKDETASKDLVDLSIASEPQFSTTSTLVQSDYAYPNPPHSRLSAPNLSNRSSHLQNWAFASRKTNNNETGGSAKLVNGHLCWKGGQPDLSPESDDITSICTEFDPLSDDNSACEQFVDSLNLSIPLKPAQVNLSQLSSIGDSLHSNSLDLGCGSTPVLYTDTRKVSNARSVDGIRELLLEKSYSKRSLQFGHSNRAVLGTKTTRKIPVTLMNCMHESSDYSLL